MVERMLGETFDKPQLFLRKDSASKLNLKVELIIALLPWRMRYRPAIRAQSRRSQTQAQDSSDYSPKLAEDITRNGAEYHSSTAQYTKPRVVVQALSTDFMIPLVVRYHCQDSSSRCNTIVSKKRMKSCVCFTRMV
jgi:hypothetical protein